MDSILAKTLALTLVTLGSLAPLGCDAPADLAARGDVTERRGLYEIPCFFADSVEFRMAEFDPGSWTAFDDSVVMIYDDGTDARFDYVIQYDYTSDSVVNVMRFAYSQRSDLHATLNHFEILTRPIIDRSEFGTQLKIRTPAPPPPPQGCPWPGLTSPTRELALASE